MGRTNLSLSWLPFIVNGRRNKNPALIMSPTLQFLGKLDRAMHPFSVLLGAFRSYSIAGCCFASVSSCLPCGDEGGADTIWNAPRGENSFQNIWPAAFRRWGTGGNTCSILPLACGARRLPFWPHGLQAPLGARWRWKGDIAQAAIQGTLSQDNAFNSIHSFSSMYSFN